MAKNTYHTLSAFIVADVTISLRSLRLVRTENTISVIYLWQLVNVLFRNNPMRTSVLKDLSCASSKMITLYRSRSPSFSDSRNKTPSVMSTSYYQPKQLYDKFDLHLILVSLDVQSSNRIAYPTVPPSLHYQECQISRKQQERHRADLHFLADTFCHRHSGDTARLRTANDTISTKPILV